MRADTRRLAQTVREHLLAQPRTSLVQLAAALGVERHTITRACRRHFGMTFRRLQGECLAERLRMLPDRSAQSAMRLSVSALQPSIKEIAASLGYRHPASLIRRLRREGRCVFALPDMLSADSTPADTEPL